MAIGWTVTAANEPSAGNTPYTLSSISIGASASDRIVVFCLAGNGAYGSVSGVTMNTGGGAVSMNSAVAASGGASAFFTNAAIFYLADSSGSTTATFVITTSGGHWGSPIYAVAQLTGLQNGASATPSAAFADANPVALHADPQTSDLSITVPSAGIGTIFAFGPYSGTWALSNATTDSSTVPNYGILVGHTETAGSITPTSTGGSDYSICWALAAWNGASAATPTFRRTLHSTGTRAGSRGMQDREHHRRNPKRDAWLCKNGVWRMAA